MLIIKNLILKNFLSVGQCSQDINFDRKDLTLILGENLDLGGDGARNGTGKTTIIQGLSYALFGSAINNIKKDNLINRTNGKNMLATVEFHSRGTDYKIVRGRKPNILKFYVNNQEQQITDDSQGDSRETQNAVERILNMSPDMFKQIVALNTYNEPFLAMRVADQRAIIEQLLGITQLSEKAEAIKELNKETKDQIQQEEYRVRGQEEANKRIQEQIDSLKRRQKLWNLKHEQDLSNLVTEYENLSKIDIDAELTAHKQLSEYNIQKEKLDRYNSLLARQITWKEKLDKEISELESKRDALRQLNIDEELQAHKTLIEYTQLLKEQSEYLVKIQRLEKDLDREVKIRKKTESEIKKLKDHKCYACGQDFHDSNHDAVLNKKISEYDDVVALIKTINSEIELLKSNPIKIIEKPVTHYSSETEAFKHSSELQNIEQQVESKRTEVDPYQEQLLENAVSLTIGRPVTKYDTEAEAFKHSNRVSSLLENIQHKSYESDPYSDQISEMESHALQTISFDEINRLIRILQHQEYLLDLLTNKKSFVRKRIIEQNLGYLNSRLTHYLDKMGLPHQVLFQNDLSVDITELGRDSDFDSLSRGERNRVIIGLSFAFRDVWESLYSSINVLFVDELIDSGMDTMGVENGLALLKDMARKRNKSVWLVSHKDDLSSRVDNILMATKINGFSEYLDTYSTK